VDILNLQKLCFNNIYCQLVEYKCLLSISTYSWSSPHYYSSKRVKGCTSRWMCYIHHPCHWNRAKLPVAVEASWKGKWGVAAVSHGVVPQHYLKYSQSSEVRRRKLPVCCQQLCWSPDFQSSKALHW